VPVCAINHLTDEQAVRCRRHFCQLEGRSPESNDGQDPRFARREGRDRAENIRYMRSEMMIPGTLKRDYLGKINLYVANQNDIDTLGADELAALETECKTVEEANNTVAAQVKSLQSGFERRSRHACSV
jgi:hypothetical protein